MKRKISLVLIFTLLFNIVSFSNFVFGADFESENQKAYI